MFLDVSWLNWRRTANNGAMPMPQALAAGSFWQRLAAAAVAAAPSACSQSAQPQQRQLHTRQLISPQTDLYHGGASRLATDHSTVMPEQQRGFATRGTRASRTAGGKAAPARGSDSPVDGKAGAREPASTEPTAADLEAAERERSVDV